MTDAKASIPQPVRECLNDLPYRSQVAELNRQMLLFRELLIAKRRNCGQRRVIRYRTGGISGLEGLGVRTSTSSNRQFAAHHPQVRQHQQRRLLRAVLRLAPMARLGVAELPLEHSERMLRLRPDARLDPLELVAQRVDRPARVQRFGLVRRHGYRPSDALSSSPVANAPAARLGEDVFIPAMQQLVDDVQVVDVDRRADMVVDQARVRIHGDVCLHAEVTVVARPRLVLLRIARAGAVLCRVRRFNQRGIDRRAGLQHHALGGQAHHAFGQLFNVAEQRHVGQRFFHRRIGRADPLLQEVDAQHRLDRKRGPSDLSTRAVRLDQRDQLRPRHNPIHLVEELALARLLGRQLEAQVRLFHTSDRATSRPDAPLGSVRGFADAP